jgi:hypothetical protein
VKGGHLGSALPSGTFSGESRKAIFSALRSREAALILFVNDFIG